MSSEMKQRAMDFCNSAFVKDKTIMQVRQMLAYIEYSLSTSSCYQNAEKALRTWQRDFVVPTEEKRGYQSAALTTEEFEQTRGWFVNVSLENQEFLEFLLNCLQKKLCEKVDEEKEQVLMIANMFSEEVVVVVDDQVKEAPKKTEPMHDFLNVAFEKMQQFDDSQEKTNVQQQLIKLNICFSDLISVGTPTLQEIVFYIDYGPFGSREPFETQQQFDTWVLYMKRKRSEFSELLSKNRKTLRKVCVRASLLHKGGKPIEHPKKRKKENHV